MRSRTRAAALLTTSALAAVLLAGCAAGDDWSEPHDAPTAVGALRDGFLPTTAPSPEATIAPLRDSWADVHPSAGYRVVLLTAGDDAPAVALADAVTEWAADEKVDLRTVRADDDHVGGIVEAMDLHPDLIVSAGNDLIDALAAVTASHLDQQFLVVGAEVAEPTGNVTAVDWTGASFRGEGLGASSTYDPTSFTPERCASAVRAGVASVLHDLTGIVLWLD
ncbi:hypothetical protein B7R54_15470 [Subtercola boreus]|uniref:ABC transporter substrate-binding protein PnrA-like domain-containing protein n=1 Tax=Subtercola boreus TaxID=120213 RepID=A0A3E0VLD0_9MICO|nr:hypothetical protein [Subtercola boreus]RFA10445.1 hypothetical protein B7R54_15470 [Subtercola boreus]TQL56027.1 hypothetical protein FB464_3603 [Subtercola boreus]